jgi:glutamate dehydrogenase
MRSPQRFGATSLSHCVSALPPRSAGTSYAGKIVATVIVNEMVDFGGLTSAFRLAEDTAATTEDAARAFTVVAEVLDLRGIWHRIRAAPAPVTVCDELELETRRTLDRASRWVLANRPQPVAVGADIARYRDGTRRLSAALSETDRRNVSERACRAADHGVPTELVAEVFGLADRHPVFDVLDIAEIADRDADEVVALHCALADRLGVGRLLDAVDRPDHDGRWGTRARLMLDEDLYGSLRALTLAVLAATDTGDSAREKIERWESIAQARLTRARTVLADIFTADNPNFAMLSVAVRRIGSLAHSV